MADVSAKDGSQVLQTDTQTDSSRVVVVVVVVVEECLYGVIKN